MGRKKGVPHPPDCPHCKGGWKLTEETRGRRGPLPEETRAKISRANKGQNKGEANGNWRGDTVQYRAAHSRVAVARGPAKDHICKCGAQARHWASLTGDYADINDYEAMCAPCHVRYDRGRR